MTSAIPADSICDGASLPVLCFPEVILYPEGVVPLLVRSSEHLGIIHGAQAACLPLVTVAVDPKLVSQQYQHLPGVGSLARVLCNQPLQDGGEVVLLRGIGRVAIEPVAQADHSASGDFSVRATRLQDRYPQHPAIDRDHRRLELLAGLANCRGRLNELPQDFHLSDQVLLGPLCDLIAQLLGFPNETSQQLLETLNVDLRSDLLLDAIRAKLRQERPFPPEFSRN